VEQGLRGWGFEGALLQARQRGLDVGLGFSSGKKPSSVTRIRSVAKSASLLRPSAAPLKPGPFKATHLDLAASSFSGLITLSLLGFQIRVKER
jgi:hypothetical protein